MRLAWLSLLCCSVLSGVVLAQDPTPESSPTATPEPTPTATPAALASPSPEATPSATPVASATPETVKPPTSPDQPVLLPEGTAPVNEAARDAAFKEVGEQPPSSANPPPAGQGAPPVTGEDVIPLPDGTAIPADANQMPGEPSTTNDEQLVMPDDIPAPISGVPAGIGQSGPSARELQVKYVEARTKVEKDEKVRSLKLQADKAKTDEDKRQALRAYYRLLFQKIRKLDSSLVAKCDVLEAAFLRRLEQSRIEPTIPLNPPPTPEPLP